MSDHPHTHDAKHPHHHHDGACCHDHDHNHAHNHAVTPVDTSALMSVRGLSFARSGRDILTGIDLDVHANEIVTLIGPNGGGKSTLVKLMLGIERPDSGRIFRAKDCRVGYVPQRFEVERAMPMNVASFLGLGLDVSMARIEEALTEVGVLATRNTQVSSLSGGETQRVLIARALLRKPNLLVLDEPVRGVDMGGEADLYNLIARLRDRLKFGVLLVSHDMHVVMGSSDRVVCINHHICCSGQPEAVSRHPEYARLFGGAAARTFGVYLHDHDHRHDLSGALAVDPENGTTPATSDKAGDTGGAG